MSSAASPPPGSSRPPRNTATVVVVVVAVLAVVIGFVAIGVLVGGSGSTAGGPGSTPSRPSPSTPAPSTPSPSTPGPGSPTASNLPALNCAPAPKAPGSPQQFPKAPSPALARHSTWQVTLTTNCGPIVMDLNGKAAPQTVASFLYLADKKYFDDSPCHRLTTAGIFVLQCGDPTGTGSGGPGYGYGIENAPASGSYPTGTVAMANTGQPDSNGSQFFIVYADTSLQPGGYSIFGKVVKGLSIVKAVAARTQTADGPPGQPISILSVSAKKL